MKRLIIAVCMLITGIAISIGGYVNLKSICRNMSCSVNEVIRAAENGDADETKRKCDDTEKMWDKKSPLLGVYTNHSEMDELMMLMKQIRQLSTDKDYDELIEKCRESIYRFEHIAETVNALVRKWFLVFRQLIKSFSWQDMPLRAFLRDF